MRDDRNDLATGDEELDENLGAASPDATVYAKMFGTTAEIVSRYTRCTFCGGNLHFSHITHFGQNVTQETARCPECGVKMRSTSHKLQ